MDETDQDNGESEDIVERETAAAAAEGGAVGGRRPDDEPDSPERAVDEGGGGVSEGFELSEKALRDHAEHRDAGGNPKYDRSRTEEERVDAEYGEADHVESAEVEDEGSTGG